jgi:hypothetical protein
MTKDLPSSQEGQLRPRQKGPGLMDLLSLCSQGLDSPWVVKGLFVHFIPVSLGPQSFSLYSS